MIKAQHINFFFDTSKRKREIWKRTQAARDTFERKYTMLFRTILNRHFKAVSDRVDVSNYLNDNLPDTIIDDNTVKLMLIDLYKNVGASFAKNAYRQLLTQGVKEEEDMGDYWLHEMEKYVKTTLGNRIVSITKGSRDQAKAIIRRMIQQGTDEGWGADVTARAIKQALTKEGVELNMWRALRIARTEVMTASNVGAMEGAKSLNVPMVKYWIATYDSRTRDTHLVIEQQNPLDIDDDFKVGEYDMSQPGDPRGGAEETVNCRCTIAFGVKQ
jgi:hypothetical protein